MDNIQLHAQDLLVVLKFAVTEDVHATVRQLGAELDLSKSAVAVSIQRLLALGLLREVDGKRRVLRVQKLALRDCIEHAVRWIAPASIGEWELGLPTAHSHSPIANKLRGDADAVVMPLPHGPVRGRAVAPLHPKAPFAAAKDAKLHDLLSIVDAFRVGRARDREIAAQELRSWV